MAMAWVYVINDGSGVPRVVRRSHVATTVHQQQTGVYLVTFPSSVRGLACVATLNNSVGTITVTPGDNAGLPPNQVTVVTLTLGNQALGVYDFSLAVFYNPSRVAVDTTDVITATARARKRKRQKTTTAGSRTGRRRGR